MFSGVKEKLISAVQDGIDLNNTVRRKLSEVKKSKLQTKSVEKDIIINIDPNAGSEILTKYQNDWKDIHGNAEKNARIAEDIDETLTNIQASIKQQLDNIVSINVIFSMLPQVTYAVDNCISTLGELSTMCEVVEDDLIGLEKLIERAEFKHRQQEHIIQLTMYQEKKFAELEKNRVALAQQKASIARTREQEQRGALLEKQVAAHNAFLNDLQTYKLQGALPKKSDVNVDQEKVLEDIQLDDDNNEELNDFLNT